MKWGNQKFLRPISICTATNNTNAAIKNDMPGMPLSGENRVMPININSGPKDRLPMDSTTISIETLLL